MRRFVRNRAAPKSMSGMIDELVIERRRAGIKEFTGRDQKRGAGTVSRRVAVPPGLPPISASPRAYALANDCCRFAAGFCLGLCTAIPENGLTQILGVG